MMCIAWCVLLSTQTKGTKGRGWVHVCMRLGGGPTGVTAALCGKTQSNS
jgi:hypothetical protein